MEEKKKKEKEQQVIEDLKDLVALEEYLKKHLKQQEAKRRRCRRTEDRIDMKKDTTRINSEFG